MDDTLLTTTEAAARLAITPAYLVRLAQSMGVELIRIGPDTRGGRWVIRARDVERLRELRLASPPKRGPKPQAEPTKAAAAQRRSRARRRGDPAE